jgi:hypothetical protein
MTTTLAPIVAEGPRVLDAQEAEELARLESAIERGLSAFLEVGLALLRIRDGRLYRATHDTFEAYCRDRWGMTARHADRTIQAAAIVESFGPMGLKIPANERQVRPLAQLPEPDRPDAWREAVETANGSPTCADVQRAVNRRRPKETPRPWTKWDAVNFVHEKLREAWERWPPGKSELLARLLIDLGQELLETGEFRS